MGRNSENRHLGQSLCLSIAGGMLAFGLTGCGYSQPKTQSISTLQRTPVSPFNVAPREMVKRIEQAVAQPPLSLSVESSHDGVVQTGWKEYRGDLHIVRYWYERTKFQIVVTPDFDDPAGKCRVQVFDQTEERATESQPWYPVNDRQRPERSSEVLSEIKTKIGS